MKSIVLLSLASSLLLIDFVRCEFNQLDMVARSFAIDKLEDEGPDGNNGNGEIDNGDGEDHKNALDFLTPDEIRRLGGGDGAANTAPQQDFNIGGIFNGLLKKGQEVLQNIVCAPMCDRYKACRLSCLLHPDMFSCDSCEFDPTRLIPCGCQLRFCKDMKSGKIEVDGCWQGKNIPITKGGSKPGASLPSMFGLGM